MPWFGTGSRVYSEGGKSLYRTTVKAAHRTSGVSVKGMYTCADEAPCRVCRGADGGVVSQTGTVHQLQYRDMPKHGIDQGSEAGGHALYPYMGMVLVLAL